MAYGNHIFIAFGLQANTHVNVHHELKDVKLWQVTIFFFWSLYVALYLFQIIKVIFIFVIPRFSN
jgi:hypothetical protein